MVRAAQRTNATFHLLVPATPLEAGTDESAEDRLETSLARFRERGLRMTGEVGAADPLEAVGKVCARGDCDRVIIATLPRSASRWLHMDLPHRVARRWHVLIEWVTVADGPDQPSTLATIRPIAPRARV